MLIIAHMLVNFIVMFRVVGFMAALRRLRLYGVEMLARLWRSRLERKIKNYSMNYKLRYNQLYIENDRDSQEILI